MSVLIDAAALVLAYVIGAIPTGLLVARQFARIDIREHGSKNIGATNVWRVLGWKLGLATFLLDVGKALVAVLAVPLLAAGAIPDLAVYTGLAVLLGNFFNVFLGGRGGKGVATSLGVFLGLAPLAVACALGLFVVLVWATRFISVGSIGAALALPFLAYGFGASTALMVMVVVVAALVVFKHRTNIRRLAAGTETRFRFRRDPA